MDISPPFVSGMQASSQVYPGPFARDAAFSRASLGHDAGSADEDAVTRVPDIDPPALFRHAGFALSRLAALPDALAEIGIRVG